MPDAEFRVRKISERSSGNLRQWKRTRRTSLVLGRFDGGLVYIPLNHGMEAVVDALDYPKVANFIWRVDSARDKGQRLFYAVTGTSHLPMHRLIAGCPVDHKDGDGLNNTRSNLRPCSQAQNRRNSRKTTNPCTSRFKGVRKSRGRFYAAIMVGGVRKNLGGFANEEDAALAYDVAARELHGSFARLNFPEAA